MFQYLSADQINSILFPIHPEPTAPQHEIEDRRRLPRFHACTECNDDPLHKTSFPSPPPRPAFEP